MLFRRRAYAKWYIYPVVCVPDSSRQC